MPVGRKRCNLNKTTVLAAYKVIGKTPNSSHLCEGDSTVVLTETSIFSSYIKHQTLSL
jgi:hypothetical protein